MPASRKLAKKEAADLVKKASKVIVAKGKKVSEFPGGKATAEVDANPFLVNALREWQDDRGFPGR